MTAPAYRTYASWRQRYYDGDIDVDPDPKPAPTRCQCDVEFGTCPGPTNCPNSDCNQGDDE